MHSEKERDMKREDKIGEPGRERESKKKRERQSERDNQAERERRKAI